MKKLHTRIQIVFFLALGGCAKLAIPLNQALSNLVGCETRLEYRFPITQVTDTATNFMAVSTGGTVTRLTDTCTDLEIAGPSTLPPEHSLIRSTSDLTVKAGTETVMALKISSGQLSGSLPETCRNGKKAIHTLESGVISASPKEVRITVATKVLTASCP
jgi:hypothetical protein